MEELLEAPQLGRNPHLLHTLSTLVMKKLAQNGYFFYAYLFMLRDKFKYLQTESFSGILELVAMLFSGRSNAENRTDVVSVRLQPFNVEQCNNITVMLKTGN